MGWLNLDYKKKHRKKLIADLLRKKANKKNRELLIRKSNKNGNSLKKNPLKITSSKKSTTKYKSNIQLSSDTIVVIGNGTSVLEREMGDIINAFQHVVRFNDFQIKGYERYIGSKTTIWARSNSNITQDRVYGNFDQVLIVSPEWNYNNVSKFVKGHKNAFAIPMEYVIFLQEEMGLSGRTKDDKQKKLIKGWPSTGLITLYFLLKRYKEVYIYGFDYFREEEGASRHYYNGKEIINSHVHNSSVEEKWVRTKIKENRIRLLNDYRK